MEDPMHVQIEYCHNFEREREPWERENRLFMDYVFWRGQSEVGNVNIYNSARLCFLFFFLIYSIFIW